MLNRSNLLNILNITKELKVLYVEDNKEVRTQALKMFKNYFSHVDISIDGADGLNSYKNYFIETNSYYDLVITDIEMPNMNGIDMSKNIYKINEKQKIIVTSAYDDKKYLIELINIGVECFIQKPLSLKQLSLTLKKVCKELKNSSVVTLTKTCTYHKLSNELFFDNKKIDLTKNEHNFIELLINNMNLSFTPEDIFNHIFYDEPLKKFSIDSIKGLLKRIRKKLPHDLILFDRTNGYSIHTD